MTATVTPAANDRVPFHHERTGHGEPIVLLHGVSHHLQGWLPVARLLADTNEVIALDSPGFGRSEPLSCVGPPTIDAYCDAVAGWFAGVGLDRPHLAGNSMGGAIALELARRGLVRSVTAISPAGFWTAAERRHCQRTIAVMGSLPRSMRPLALSLASRATGRTAMFAAVFARPWRVPPEETRSMMRDAWASPVLGAVLDAFDEYSFRAPAQPLGIPVTIAWGSRDRLLIYGRQAPRARRALPSARHVTLDRLGHTPFYDDPLMVARVIAETAAGA